MRFAVVIEKADGNYSAYVPDLPGCIATGKTIDEVRQTIREAIQLHIEGMLEDGGEVPEPTTEACVEVMSAPAGQSTPQTTQLVTRSTDCG